MTEADTIPEPRLGRGSPEVPGSVPLPQPGDAVFVDTSVMFHEWYRRPLAICGLNGFLDISWSPYVAAEVARVATRNYVEKQLTTSPTRDEVMQAIGLVREEIDRVIALHERIWSSPIPTVLADATSRAAQALIRDEKDRPVLAGALATNSTFLLTLDAGLRHGDQFDRVVYWHPDTFLYAFFLTNRDHYAVVREEMDVQPRVQLTPRSATP